MESSHRFLQLLEVLLLISELLLQLQELLFFALLDGIVLVGLLALLKGVTINNCLSASSNDHSGAWETYPWPPVLGGAPVSPPAMTRVLVVKAARD
jgi:hypothetical protein